VAGSRIEVLLNVECQAQKQYYPGTVQRIDRSVSPPSFHIFYDDGDQESLDLTSEEFRLLPAKVATVAAKTVPFWQTNLQQRWEQELKEVPEEERDSIVTTMLRSLADGTRSTYSSPQNQYISFCSAHSLVALPGSTVTVLRFLNSVKNRKNKQGDGPAVQASSLQPYLSGINKLHVDAGLEPPALGSALVDYRKGMGREQQETAPEGSNDRLRIYLPATLVVKMRELAKHMCTPKIEHLARPRAKAAAEQFRSLVYSVFNFCLFARSDTGVKLLGSDIWQTELGLHVTLRSLKGKKHTGHIKPLLFPNDAVPGLRHLVTAFVQLQKLLGTPQEHNLWRFPWEKRGTWPASLGDDWLQQALQLVGGPEPPVGCKWTAHSTRKGATTAAAAIGVVDTVYCYVGDWSIKSSARLDYIDPTARPTAEMLEFFGWLLPSRFSQPGQDL
jgi:hypothetical protein